MQAKAAISPATPGPYHFGDVLAFNVTPKDDQSTIQLHAYQNGQLVFSDARATYEGGLGYGVPFVLGPSAAWTGGAAECTAQLGHRQQSGNFHVDAETSFHVDA